MLTSGKSSDIRLISEDLFFYADLCGRMQGNHWHDTTVYFIILVYYLYTYKMRTDVIKIPYDLYTVLKRPKIFWHNRYIPPGFVVSAYNENREGIPMSSYAFKLDIGPFLCGFLML